MARTQIPKILHQVWVGPDPIPEAARAFTRSWAGHHPGWEVRLWTDENRPLLINEATYRETLIPAQKADILRHELLHRFGGVYVDVDFECFRSLEPLIEGVGYFYGDERPGRPAIGILGCSAAHPFARHCLRRLPQLWPWQAGKILEETGPDFFRRAILDYLGRPGVEPFHDPRTGKLAGLHLKAEARPPLWAMATWVFYPYYLREAWRPEDHPDAYAAHHWQKNW